MLSPDQAHQKGLSLAAQDLDAGPPVDDECVRLRARVHRRLRGAAPVPPRRGRLPFFLLLVLVVGVQRASASPPPPPYHRASFLDVDVEDDSDDSHLAVTALEDRPLVDAEQVERRMARWDAERRLCQEEEVLKVDGRMDTGLRLLGL